MTLRHSADEEVAIDHFMVLHDPQAAPEALQAALQWIDAAPENRVLFDRIGRFWWAVEANPQALTPQRFRVLRTWWPRQRQAAGWLIAICTAAALLFATLYSSHAPAPLPTQHYATNTGEIRRIQLPDGSIVTLGAGSQ